MSSWARLEADHGADPAAVGGGLQHLLARIGHVAGRVEARYRRRPGRVRLHEVPEPGRVCRGSEAERRERLGAHPEPGTDHDRVGVDAFAGRPARPPATWPSAPVTMRLDLPVDDLHPAGSQGVELGVVHVGGVVEHDGEPGAELAEQPGRVESRRVGDDLDDSPVADLVSVAERAVDDVAPPVLREAVDVGELVDQTGGGKHPASDDGVTADELDAEVARHRCGSRD